MGVERFGHCSRLQPTPRSDHSHPLDTPMVLQRGGRAQPTGDWSGPGTSTAKVGRRELGGEAALAKGRWGRSTPFPGG